MHQFKVYDWNLGLARALLLPPGLFLIDRRNADIHVTHKSESLTSEERSAVLLLLLSRNQAHIIP
jgi:hypothetical protein